MGVKIKKKNIKKVDKKMVEKKVGSKKVGEKNQKIKKKKWGWKQAVVEVASEVLFGLVQNGALVWPRSKLTLEIQLFWLKKFSIEWFSHKTFAREKIFFENVRHITNSL